jgi:putative addiction module killer protein
MVTSLLPSFKETFLLAAQRDRRTTILDVNGKSPYEEWFIDLHAPAAAKVTAAVARMEQGNFSDVKGVGPGVFEYRLDFGPGYRIYFGKDGEQILVLLGGGTKKR